MIILKKSIRYLKYSAYIIGSIILTVLIISLFSYYDVFNSNTTSILKLIFSLSAIFIGAFLLGKRSLNKGFLKGIYLGLYLVGFFIFLAFVLGSNFSILKALIYYGIVIVTSMLGSMVGINYQKR